MYTDTEKKLVSGYLSAKIIPSVATFLKYFATLVSTI